MEIKHLSSGEINKDKWDDLIRNSGEGNVYGLYDFLSGCERQWKAVLLIQEGSYVAGIPLQFKTSFFYPYVYQDPFAHELGLYQQKNIEAPLIGKMLHAAFDHHKLVSAYFFNVDNSFFLEEQKVLKKENLFRKKTYFLDLQKSYQEILASYSTNRKRDLKKARKYRQTITESTDLGPLISIFKEYTAKKIKGIRAYQYELIRSSLLQQLNSNIGELYYVEYEGEPISAVFITKFKNKIVFLFGAHAEKALELRSSTLVLDHILHKYAGQPYVFDFEGSDDPKLARFYSSFGAREVSFYGFSKNELPFFVKLVKKLRVSLLRKVMNVFS